MSKQKDIKVKLDREIRALVEERLEQLLAPRKATVQLNMPIEGKDLHLRYHIPTRGGLATQKPVLVTLEKGPAPPSDL